MKKRSPLFWILLVSFVLNIGLFALTGTGLRVGIAKMEGITYQEHDPSLAPPAWSLYGGQVFETSHSRELYSGWINDRATLRKLTRLLNKTTRKLITREIWEQGAERWYTVEFHTKEDRDLRTFCLMQSRSEGKLYLVEKSVYYYEIREKPAAKLRQLLSELVPIPEDISEERVVRWRPEPKFGLELPAADQVELAVISSGEGRYYTAVEQWDTIHLSDPAAVQKFMKLLGKFYDVPVDLRDLYGFIGTKWLDISLYTKAGEHFRVHIAQSPNYVPPEGTYLCSEISGLYYRLKPRAVRQLDKFLAEQPVLEVATGDPAPQTPQPKPESETQFPQPKPESETQFPQPEVELEPVPERSPVSNRAPEPESTNKPELEPQPEPEPEVAFDFSTLDFTQVEKIEFLYPIENGTIGVNVDISLAGEIGTLVSDALTRAEACAYVTPDASIILFLSDASRLLVQHQSTQDGCRLSLLLLDAEGTLTASKHLTLSGEDPFAELFAQWKP